MNKTLIELLKQAAEISGNRFQLSANAGYKMPIANEIIIAECKKGLWETSYFATEQEAIDTMTLYIKTNLVRLN